MNIDMLVFGEDWGLHPSSTQHLIHQLMQTQHVVWVNSLGLRRPKLNMQDAQRVWRKVAAMAQRTKREQSASNTPQPTIVQPRALCWPASRTVRRLNEHLLRHQLKPLLQHSQTRPLLWTSLPSAVDIVGHMGERAAIYYCGDDFSALDGVDHQPVTEMEQELAEKCDLIITASEALATKFPRHKTRILHHGVDTRLFSQPVARATEMPTGPVAGFYGAIAGWFDQQLYIDVVRRLRHWTFLLIGPAKCDISALLAEPNIIWLGPKPHHELPHYSQHWDVGLLPFKRNAQIQACNPLKLREYLAAGSPVVTTDYPALVEYHGLVNISNTAEHFAYSIEQQHACVGKAHRKSNEAQRQQRQNAVAHESWHARATQLSHFLRAIA